MILSEIRQAQEEDATRIVALLLLLGYETTPSIVEALIANSHRKTDEINVGIREGVIVAVMTLIYFDYFPSAEKRCRITAIVVDEHVRDQGIGTALMDYAKARAKAERCKTLEITTSLLRHHTHSFYESRGFRKTSYMYVQELDHSIEEK